MGEKDDQEKAGETSQSSTTDSSRRDFLKSSVIAAGAGLAAAAMPGLTQAGSQGHLPENPYGARPGGGISLPDYYKPWPAIKNRNMYLPGTEILPKNEMRVTFLP